MGEPSMSNQEVEEKHRPKKGVLCMYCLMYGNPMDARGVTTVEDILETDEDLVEHIEMVHCIVVRRDGETSEQAKARVGAKNPRYGTNQCTCPRCFATKQLLRSFGIA